MSIAMSYLPVRNFSTIRIKCHHQDCGVATEIRPELVETVMKKTGCCCPACGKPFNNPKTEGGADVITQLAKVVLALNSLAPQVGLELPVPVEL